MPNDRYNLNERTILNIKILIEEEMKSSEGEPQKPSSYWEIILYMKVSFMILLTSNGIRE